MITIYRCLPAKMPLGCLSGVSYFPMPPDVFQFRYLSIEMALRFSPDASKMTLQVVFKKNLFGGSS